MPAPGPPCSRPAAPGSPSGGSRWTCVAVAVSYHHPDWARAAESRRRAPVLIGEREFVGSQKLQLLKLWVSRLWLFSPERLWLASIALHRRGHWVLAFWVKQVNSLVYHNSLAPGASVSPDVRLGHNSIGIVVNSEVEIGRRVKIWQ